jgi:hypothetical protein
MTPRSLAMQCAAVLNPTGTILEPCAGTGAFVRALKPYASGPVRECELSRGQDFLQWSRPVDWIITNPPWSEFRAFLGHAMTLAPDIAFLVTVNHWWTKARVRMVKDAGFGYARLWMVPYPIEFPNSGFQLGLMHIQFGYDGTLAVYDEATFSQRRAS